MAQRGGLVLMTTAKRVPPVVNIGLYDYPTDPVADARPFDGMEIAMKLGEPGRGNTVMPGAPGDRLPFPAQLLLNAIVKRFAAKKPLLVEPNHKAFAADRAAVATAAPT